MFRVLLLTSCFLMNSLFGAPKILVGIAGGTGSGKTTFADKIKEAFPSNSVLISQDSYYKDLSHLSIEGRSETNFDHPSALDFAMIQQHLIDLKNGCSIDQPIYNFQTHCREEGTQKIESAQIIIVEGILLFTVPGVRDLLDLKIFVDTDDDIRVLRRIERDISERSRDFDSIKEQYMTTVKPMHDAFVQPSKQYADIIVPRGGHNQTALGLILAKLNEDLEILKP